MVYWTPHGYFTQDERANELLEKAVEKINERIIKFHEKITVRQLYNQCFGGIYDCDLLPLFRSLSGEFFIDPDDWGWDEKGFRRLYRTRTIREEL